MSVLDRLSQRTPRDEKLMLNCREHSSIFAETVERYMSFSTGSPVRSAAVEAAFVHRLAARLMSREEAAAGALLRSQQATDEEEAAQYAGHAGKQAQLTLIYAFGLQKACLVGEGEPGEIAVFATDIIENILTAFTGFEPAYRVYNALAAAQQRGWSEVAVGTAVPIVNGANWCPDTAKLAESANALAVPLALMFSEYIQLPEDKGRRKQGIFIVQDHAQAVYEDGFEKPGIPVVRYPNGATHFEPDIFLFVEQLAENGLV